MIILAIKAALGGIGGFISKHWKLFLLLAALGALYWYHTNAIEKAEDRGFDKAEKQFKALVAAEDKRNREIEAKIAESIKVYGEKIAKENGIRVEKETIIRETLKESVSDPIYEQCIAGEDVMIRRNAIRELGPK